MIKPVTSVKLTGRRVLLRVGFDVPLETQAGGTMRVVDESRIKAALPTIKYLIEQKAKIIIISHLGRPDGQWLKEKTLLPAAERLAHLLGRKLLIAQNRLSDYASADHVYFLDQDITVGNHADFTEKLQEGEILFLENLRFYKGEEENDTEFAKILAEYADVYVDEAFSVAHREAASNAGVAKLLPSYAGIEFANEISALSRAVKNPQPPLVVIMGGAKISDKIDTINFLAPIAEKILVGGAIANSFLKAAGYEIGHSKAAEIPLAKEILRQHKGKIVLPSDLVVAKSEDAQARAATPDKVLPTEAIYDIGPETIRAFAEVVKTARTLIWNGPLGLIEKKKFSFGSMSVAQVFSSVTKGQAYGIVGGGETLEIVAQAHVAQFIDHISTGGGAMLEFLGGKTLPAIKVLDK